MNKLTLYFSTLLFFLQPISIFGQLNQESPYLYSMGGCGFLGNSKMPESAVHMIEHVNNRNYNELKRWLESPYPEIQAFGVKGIHFLCQIGVPIEEEDLEIIDCLIESSVSVKTCAGCVYWSEPMKNLLKYENLASSFWYCKNEGYLH